MPSGIPTLSIPTLPPAYDAAGVRAALLDIAAHLNEQVRNLALDLSLRSDNQLADGIIRQRHLHTELGSFFKVLQAHIDAGGIILAACRCATIGDVVLAGLQTIDGQALNDGDRVLVRAQAIPAQNGVYVAHAGAWLRAGDADSLEELAHAFVFVEFGATLDATSWFANVLGTGTLGTVDVPWLKVNRGPVGPQGIQGIQGTAGTNGTNGTNGADGAPGVYPTIPDGDLLGNISGAPATAIGLSPAQVAGALKDWKQAQFYNFASRILSVAGITVLDVTNPGWNGAVVLTTDGGDFTMTLPKAGRIGFSVTIIQAGAGVITFAAEAGGSLVNRRSHTKTAGANAAVTLVCTGNNADPGGTAAAWLLGGDTSA